MAPRSLLSLISYLGSGEYRDRYLGLKVRRTFSPSNSTLRGSTFSRDIAYSDSPAASRASFLVR
jgi:hypothetical protein